MATKLTDEEGDRLWGKAWLRLQKSEIDNNILHAGMNSEGNILNVLNRLSKERLQKPVLVWKADMK